jgi:hypothetical protein
MEFFVQERADLTGLTGAITCGEPASLGLSAADILSAELLNVIEVGATQQSKHKMPKKWAPVVEEDTSKDFLCEGERQALLLLCKRRMRCQV